MSIIQTYLTHHEVLNISVQRMQINSKLLWSNAYDFMKFNCPLCIIYFKLKNQMSNDAMHIIDTLFMFVLCCTLCLAAG